MSLSEDEPSLRLLDALVVPMLVLAPDGRVRWLNAAAERLLAWPRALLGGHPLEVVIPERLHAVYGVPLHRVLVERAGAAAERPLRLPALRRDGVEIETECSISALGDGTLVLSLQRRGDTFGVDRLEARPPAAQAPPPPADTLEHLQRYRLLFDHAPLGIWHFDERGVITACNDPFVRVMGSSKRALVGLNQLTLRDVFVVECVRGALAGERTHYEGDYVSATGGKVTPVRADFAPIRAPDGKVIGGVGILEDITERKRAEEALRQSNATLRAVFEASPLPIVALGVDTRVHMWNPAAERFFGWTEQEVLGEPLPCVPPERAAEFRQTFDGIAQGRLLVSLETYYRHRDGRRLDVSVSGAPLSHGAGVIAVVADISESKRALAERARLLQQEQVARRTAEAARRRLQVLAEASAEIASSLDEQETVQCAARVATPSFAQLGVLYLRDDEGAVHLGAVACADGAALDTALAALAAPGPVVEEVIATGRSRWLVPPGCAWPALASWQTGGLICAPLLVRGRVLGALAWARDGSGDPFGVDDVPLAEELGRRAGVAIDNARLFQRTDQALRWRDEFLSVASHELRTPVTSLTLSAQNLEALAAEGTLATAPPGIVARGLGTVVRQTRHLSELIEQLLDLTRIQAGRFEVLPDDNVDLVDAVRATTRRLGRQLAIAGCALRLDAPAAVVGRWDRARLEQVVTNLVTNAMKFGAGRPIEIKVDERDGQARLTVTDHGIGVAPEQQPLIFDRFQRGAVSARHFAGLGLGLHIVRQIVEAHQGTIAVASVPGQGATFTVTLPTRPVTR